jgi:hypothetical protein
MSAVPVNLVYFYSDEDKVALEIESDLLKMQKANLISAWSNMQITGGKDVDAEINKKIEAAQIVLLLVSPNFDTEYNPSRIISTVIKKSQNNELHLIPILVSTFVTIEDQPYYNLIINPNAPIDVPARHKRKEACDNVSKDIMRIAREIRGDFSTQSNSTIRQNAKSLTYKKEIPSFYFLTQFCNRDEQTEQLNIALKEQRDKMQNHSGRAVPLVCIVHGDIIENVEGYKQRLISREINQLISNGQKTIREVNIKFPTRLTETSNGFEYFQKTLSAEVFEGDANAGLSDIFKRLCGHPSPVMICYGGLQTENWNEETQKAVRDFAGFFNSIPLDMRSTTQIIACLFFTYDEELSESEKSDEVKESYFSWFSKRIFASSDKKPDEVVPRKKQIQEFFGALSAEFKSDVYQNICGVVLNELPSVQKSDVETFLDSSKLFTFCQTHKPYFCRPEGIIKVKSSVVDLYKSQATIRKIGNKNVEVIPMKTLNDELSKYLEQNCCH